MKLDNLKEKYDYDYDYEFYDMENMFNIYEGNRNYLRYNLNETAYFNFDKQKLKNKIISVTQFWTTISYDLYKTEHVAWILMKINNVTSDKIFDPVEPGTKIYYPSPEVVSNILNEIQK